MAIIDCIEHHAYDNPLVPSDLTRLKPPTTVRNRHQSFLSTHTVHSYQSRSCPQQFEQSIEGLGFGRMPSRA